MTEVNELVLQVPGIGVEEGWTLAQEVAHKLSNNIPAGINLHINELNISFAATAFTGRSQMADHIVEQIITQLNNR